MRIGNRVLGLQHPTYVVAELSANHNGSLERALGLVAAAAEAGADAVKVQTYTADTLTLDCDSEVFRIQGTRWSGRTLHDLYREAHTPWSWHAPIAGEARRQGLDFFSTPFDPSAVDFLEGMDPVAHKVASFEIVDLPLLHRIGRTGRPVILSTGMATLGEIEEAVSVLRASGCCDLALLKCTSAYPAAPEDCNLRTIPHLAETFQVVPGLSDHTLGETVATAAVALGARIVEKHLCASRDEPGPDSAFSMQPAEFGNMVRAIRQCERALGTVRYALGETEQESRQFRRSLFVVKDVRNGEEFTGLNVRSIRPADGLHPRHLVEVLGRRAARDIVRGTPIGWDMIR